jgi:hypothetical protein
MTLSGYRVTASDVGWFSYLLVFRIIPGFIYDAVGR